MEGGGGGGRGPHRGRERALSILPVTWAWRDSDGNPVASPGPSSSSSSTAAAAVSPSSAAAGVGEALARWASLASSWLRPSRAPPVSAQDVHPARSSSPTSDGVREPGLLQGLPGNVLTGVMRRLEARDVVALAATAKETRENLLKNGPGWRDLVVRDFGAPCAAQIQARGEDSVLALRWIDVYRELLSLCAVVVDCSRVPDLPSFSLVGRFQGGHVTTAPNVVPINHALYGIQPNVHYRRSIRFLVPGASEYEVHFQISHGLVHTGGLVVRAFHLASSAQGGGHAPVSVRWDEETIAEAHRPPLDHYGESRFAVPLENCGAGIHVLKITLLSDAWTHYWLSGLVVQSECDNPAEEPSFGAFLAQS